MKVIIERYWKQFFECRDLQHLSHLHNIKALRLAPRHKPLTTLADIFRADLVYFDWMRIEHFWPMK